MFDINFNRISKTVWQKNWVVCFVLMIVPIIGHIPELGLSLSSNPLYFTSGLTVKSPEVVLSGQPGWNDPNIGYTTQALGHLAAQQLLHGAMPWWNPYSGVGLPLAAEMQGSSLFLPFILLLSNTKAGLLYLKLCMQVIAGFATFSLLRQLSINRRVAVLGAILYELNGTFAWMGHAPIMPVPFLPLLLFGIECALARAYDAKAGGWSWISIALAYSLYAGFPETAYINGLMAAVWSGYRLAMTPPAVRRRFMAKIGCGAIVGLLLAMPIILPFLEFLPQAYSGPHGVTSISLSPANYAMFLVPYLFGPLAYDNQWYVSALAGGYLSVSVCSLATLALVPKSQQFGLRLVLVGWIAIALAKSANMTGVAAFLDVIPFMREAWFSRYAPPSWELAGIILASFALDDVFRGRVFKPWQLVLNLLGWAAALCVALFFARPQMISLLQDQPYYPAFFGMSLTFALLAMTFVTVLLGGKLPSARGNIISCILVVEAISLFSFALLAGTRTSSYDREGVAYLQKHLGLDRFYTLGPFRPNYGALFETASINHNYLPIPKLWVDYIREHLDPAADDVGFSGDFPGGVVGGQTRSEALRRRLSAYRAIGVKFVLTPPLLDPFMDQITALSKENKDAIVQNLHSGQSISGTASSIHIKAGQISELAIMIGTYFGTADGVLLLHLCTARECVEGEGELSNASDNQPLHMTLSRKLYLENKDNLTYTITHVSGQHAVGVYLWQQPEIMEAALPPLNTPQGVKSGYTPQFFVNYVDQGPRPTLAYRDALMDIYELANPAAYFEIRGAACDLTPLGRQHVQVMCQRPTHLIRRELCFPGWHATLNGISTQISATDQIFQSVDLPAGRSDIEFTYAPPHIGWCYAAFAAGAIFLLLGVTTKIL